MVNKLKQRKMFTKKISRGPAKGVKTLKSMFERSSLEEAQVYKKIKQIFTNKIKYTKMYIIDKIKRTRKIPQYKIDYGAIKLLNNVKYEYLKELNQKHVGNI